MEKRELKRTENVDALGWPDDSFSDDLGHGEALVDRGDTTEETRPLGNHELEGARDNLDEADAGRLAVLRQGTRLDQGSTYVDLADRPPGRSRRWPGSRSRRASGSSRRSTSTTSCGTGSSAATRSATSSARRGHAERRPRGATV